MRGTIAIIGGSGGIGLAIAKRLSEEYRVINLSRSPTLHYENIHYDVLDEPSVIRAWKELSNIDLNGLIYASGYVRPASVVESTKEDLDLTLKTNLYGAIEATQHFLSLGISNKLLVYIASTAGTRPQPGWALYAAAKAGLINFALTTGEELKGYNTRVYCVSPGRCATKLRKILAPSEDPSKIMQPSELAEVVYRLTLDDGLIDRQNILVRS